MICRAIKTASLSQITVKYLTYYCYLYHTGNEKYDRNIDAAALAVFADPEEREDFLFIVTREGMTYQKAKTERDICFEPYEYKVMRRAFFTVLKREIDRNLW